MPWLPAWACGLSPAAHAQTAPASGKEELQREYDAAFQENAAFDNRTYAGALVATPGTGGVSFSGAMVSTNGSQVLTGTVAGSFFSGGGDPAKYQAGAFAIGQNSSTYKASGVFAGNR